MKGKITAIAIFCLMNSLLSIAQVVPTDYWLIKPYDMWVSTPQHMRMCNENSHCYSIKVTSGGQIIGYQDNDMYGVVSILPNGGIGVTRDFVWGVLRCFSDLPGECEPSTYPPSYSPQQDIIPILSSPGINTPTPHAKIYYSLQIEHVNIIDPTTCNVSWGGSITHSGSHFMLSSFDFGPPIGTLSNIYVTEEGMGCPPDTTNPMNCARLERYFFSSQYGRIRQEGRNDPLCDGITPEFCLGNYSIPAPGVVNWIPFEGPVEPVPVEVCM